MRLSKRQQDEVFVLEYWVPSGFNHDAITNKDITDFFAWSDRGIAHGRNVLKDRDGFCALYWAKNRRDLHISSYKRDFNELIFASDFSNFPEHVLLDIERRMKKQNLFSPEKFGVSR